MGCTAPVAETGISARVETKARTSDPRRLPWSPRGETYGNHVELPELLLVAGRGVFRGTHRPRDGQSRTHAYGGDSTEEGYSVSSINRACGARQMSKATPSRRSRHAGGMEAWSQEGRDAIVNLARRVEPARIIRRHGGRQQERRSADSRALAGRVAREFVDPRAQEHPPLMAPGASIEITSSCRCRGVRTDRASVPIVARAALATGRGDRVKGLKNAVRCKSIDAVHAPPRPSSGGIASRGSDSEQKNRVAAVAGTAWSVRSAYLVTALGARTGCT